MMTVRFPNGLAIQYNSATFASRGSVYTDIYTREGGAWVAQVPTAGCLIEVVSPCRIYNSSTSETESKIFRELRLLRNQLKTKRKKRTAK
jgi:hypothetical protein